MNNPFLDPARHDELYGQAGRLATRSNALMRAKTAGQHVPDRIASLARAHRSARSRLGFVVTSAAAGVPAPVSLPSSYARDAYSVSTPPPR